MVREAVTRWGRGLAAQHEEILRIGYFGSYARGDAGVGSDLDVVMVVAGSDEPWERRAGHWDTTSLPVPVDLIVYTRREWTELDRDTRFGRMLADETRWVVGD